MNCDTCQGNGEKSSKCFLKALDTIKQHFLMMQGLFVENAKTISHLNHHNEKLQSAINLLSLRSKSSPKRRKLSPKKAQQRRSSIQLVDNASPLLPDSQDSLNMNIALQQDDEGEIIMETEPTMSPYKPWSSRRKLDARNCENEQPTSTITGPTSESSTAWLGKAPMDKLPMAKTKMSLTLRSNSPRLKQTRLKFNDSRDNNATGSDKDTIEASPNLYSSLKHAKQSRSLLQRDDNRSVLNAKASGSNNNQHIFDLDDDESFFDLCPDPSTPQPSSGVVLPTLSGTSDTSSVVLLTPATQDIVFVDDSITEANSLNTMDFMEEAIKQDDKVSLTKLQEFEAELIRKRQFEAAKVKLNELSAAKPIAIKHEPLTELQNAMGNETTKLPEDFDIEDDEQEQEEEIFPLPIVVKQEQKKSVKELYNIDCVQCEKFIIFMGPNLNDEKIRNYLNNCRHHDERAQENNTPDGFWNPHMVSFTDDDPRNEVLVDRRFVDQQKE